MSFDFERFSFVTDVKYTPVCRDSNSHCFYYVSNIIGSPLLGFRLAELFLECDFYYSRVVPAYIFSDDFVLCSSMLQANIFCSQLLNEQHNDRHFLRANKLKCVIYTSRTTLNRIAICLFEKHKTVMAC